MARRARPREARSLQYAMVRPFNRDFPLSHQSATDGKDSLLERQCDQKEEIISTYSSSDKTEQLSFHRPGPRSNTSGTLVESKTAQWSEKGHGMMSQEDKEADHATGRPIKSIREAKAPFGLIQVKARASGCKERHASKIQQSSKKHESAAELSRVESNGSDPDLSKPLSNTVLKSPHTIVGTDGSTLSLTLSRKPSRAGFLLGA